MSSKPRAVYTLVMPQTAHTPTEHMQCMEVWGGNQAVDSGVMMAGLDAWVYSRPCSSEAGGDVHYVSSCATGRITRLLVADVSGHGAVVAGTAGALRELMRRYVNHLDQKRFVVSLNREFAALAADGRFATALAATFFAPTNHLSISNAGHPPPVLYRAKERAWTAIQAAESTTGGVSGNTPLGIFDASTYDEHGVKLNIGDMVLLYTDGLIESRRPDGRLLGVAGLLELLETLDMSRPQEFTGALLDAVAALSPGSPARDDITVLLFRPNGLVPRLSWAERLRAVYLVSRSFLRSLLPGGERMALPDLKLANVGGVFCGPLNKLWGR